MSEKMSRWGIGPVFALLSIVYGIIMLAISRYYYPAFTIPFIPYGIICKKGRKISGGHIRFRIY